MRVVRGWRPTDHYTQVPNCILDDHRLQLQDVGLFTWLMRHEQGWDTTVERIAEGRPDGYHKVNQSLKRLEEAGLVERRRYRGDDGTMRVDLWINDPQPPAKIIGGPPAKIEGRENCNPRKPRDIRRTTSKEEQSLQERLNVVTDPEPQGQTIADRARVVLNAIFEARRRAGEPVPANWPAAFGVVKQLLNAGWSDSDVTGAGLRARTISVGWMEGELRNPTVAKSAPSEFI
jgi:hypothetical protein